MTGKYIDFIGQPGLHYTPATPDINSREYAINPPNNWIKITDDYWSYVAPAQHILPIQGWKLHVSSTLGNAQQVLSIVSSYCFENSISFKFTTTPRKLLLKNSKSGNRAACGKFITIYPNETDLKHTITHLDALLVEYRSAPYILSDMRYKQGPIFYRYGGFQKIQDPTGTLCVIKPDGSYVEDARVPYYRVPNWATTPAFLIQDQLAQESGEQVPDFHGFEVRKALHFSTGGGIYQVSKDSTDYIMKEGRPHCGLDASGHDAIARIKHEAQILRALEKLNGVPHIIDEFDAWEHHYIVETFEQSMTLGRWLALNYPFSRSKSAEATAQYLNTLQNIVKNLTQTLLQLHKEGYAHGDIQPHNIIINPDTGRGVFIDFETAVLHNYDHSLSIGTPGYLDSVNDPLNARDWIGFYRSIRGALLPISAIEMLGSNKPEEMQQWITSEYGLKGSIILSAIIHAAQSEGIDASANQTALITSKQYRPTSIKGIVKDLRDSLSAAIDWSSPGLIHGDPLQYEHRLNQYSLAYGGAGVWKTLLDFTPDHPALRTKLPEWLNTVDSNLPSCIEGYFSYGLFTGIAGMIELAIRAKQQHIAQHIVHMLADHIASSDSKGITSISIESGYAGIILALTYYHEHYHDNISLKIAEQCIERCAAVLTEPNNTLIYDSSATPTGLLYGWSGVSLACMRMYDITSSQKYLDLADTCLQQDLQRLNITDGICNLATDDSRLMPYFSLGSAGVSLTMQRRTQYPSTRNHQQEHLPSIHNALIARPCAHAGLFKGEAGLIGTLLALSGHDQTSRQIALDYASLFLIQKSDDESLYAPGDFSYRFSDDLATGTIGWIYALSGNILSIFPGFPLSERRWPQ